MRRFSGMAGKVFFGIMAVPFVLGVMFIPVMAASVSSASANTGDVTDENVTNEDTGRVLTDADVTGIADLADGTYMVDVSLEGGSGRATVTSPCELYVDGGNATASIEWSSSYYDYMIVDGETFLPVNEEGNSLFEIPVTALDEPVTVTADTTAMSVPHEIEYTLTFDSESLEMLAEDGISGFWLIIPFLLAVWAGRTVYKKRKSVQRTRKC